MMRILLFSFFYEEALFISLHQCNFYIQREYSIALSHKLKTHRHIALFVSKILELYAQNNFV